MEVLLLFNRGPSTDLVFVVALILATICSAKDLTALPLAYDGTLPSVQPSVTYLESKMLV